MNSKTQILQKLLSEELSADLTSLKTQLIKIEAFQAYCIEQQRQFPEDKTYYNKYLRAIEKRLSLGQSLLRIGESELKRAIN